MLSPVTKPRKLVTAYLFITFICLFLHSSAIATTITGEVVKVADGDTITILTPEREQVKIRLYGIDTPERKQPYSRKAGQFTSSLVAGKKVQVEVYDNDRYGRIVGVVFADGVNVNEEILRAGYAWQYRKYCKADFCDDWLKLEEQAKAAKLGLWSEPKAMPPWEWRRLKR
jgi:endonuclease YncB( thermonuclease family)